MDGNKPSIQPAGRDGDAANPVLVTWLRGGLPEAKNRGAYAIVGEGAVIDSAGDVAERVFVRSGAKFFQALGSVLSGAADRFGLDDREIALMCASHGGEPEHVATATSMLRKGGLRVESLRCGAHLPLHAASAATLRARGEAPTPLHNNCSGKHAGFLLAAKARGETLDDYLDPEHPRQRFIAALVAHLAEAAPGEVETRIDGCSAPTFVMPLVSAARAFANFGAGRIGGGSRRGADLATDPLPASEWAAAAARLRSAVAKHPFQLAGTDRLCTALVSASGGTVLAKVGADGFYGAMAPAKKIGIALHIDDGSSAAGERLLTALLVRHGLLDAAAVARLGSFADPLRRNHAGTGVGSIEVALP